MSQACCPAMAEIQVVPSADTVRDILTLWFTAWKAHSLGRWLASMEEGVVRLVMWASSCAEVSQR